MIIAICGEAGSGKDSAGRELARRLGYRFYSIGDIWGEMAHKRGLSLEEFNRLCEGDESADREIDRYQKELGRKDDNFVIVGRMSAHFIPHAFRVFLKVDPKEGVRRVLQDLKNRKDEHYSSAEEAGKALQAIQAGNEKRYLRLYGVNPFDQKGYDLVIDTTRIGIDKVVDLIMAGMAERNGI